MSLTFYQIIAPIVSFLAIAYAWNLVMKQRKTVWEAMLWSVFWGAIATIALVPDSIAWLSTATGIKDRENAVLVTFLGILFLIVFYLVIRLEELERRQTRIIRGVALRKADISSKKESNTKTKA
jgi:hypothetical protein